ncbi:hypothetical protein MPF19_07090 [Polaribacter sp. Z014]|uniref:hypothetical protein n=1 Tax=unclassified Polaribacter TaxID=196858 RepID=UPI00193B24BF|nr:MULTISPECIES: hypothetical protein [unclassified Polaribacter]MCL7763179.1 hypothetical protein [Polaribacter sp. Z014]QVY67119.1 hypothetical protein JOP69_07560 [Polaribacter sp. Q13]
MDFKFTWQKKFFFIALIFYTLTAYFSVGYFNPDEHYQIIEFSGILDGNNTPQDLPWEYSKQIRSSIQPFLAFLIFKISSFFSISDPYSKALTLRLLSAVVVLLFINNFISEAKKLIRTSNWIVFYFLSYFLWFLPFINVRFSSETWSGLLFLFGITIILKNKKNYYHYLFLGLIFGSSFLFRYQIAFAILGVIFWLIFIRKEKLNKIIIILLGILFTVFLGILLDSWFYGELTIAPYNYFVENIINNKAAEFGVSPWYFYIVLILFYALLPIGILLISSTIIFTYHKKTSLITWAIIPFLIIHSLVSHKEIRFLFPLINFAPIILIVAYEYIIEKKWFIKNKKCLNISLILILLLNVFGLIFANTRAAGEGRAGIVSKIHQLNNRENLNIYVTDDFYPKYLWSLNANFYKEKNAKFINIEKDKYQSIFSTDKNTTNVLILSINDLENEKLKEIQSETNMVIIKKTFPNLLFSLFKKVNLGNKVFVLYANKKAKL